MKVLVTGANGLIGAATVRYLLARNYTIRATDLAAETALHDVEYAAADIRDFDAVREQVQGCDAVVHLAALPSPTHEPGHVTFDINVSGTFNVFEAAAQAGIQRICQASSVNAVGLTWTTADFVPDYFPIDEGQTATLSDPYSLSKKIVEEIGDYFWQRDGISSTALRLPAVHPASFYKSEEYYQMRDKGAAFLDEFVERPEEEQKRLLEQARTQILAFRKARRIEYPAPEQTPRAEELGEIPLALWNAYMWDRYMLWTLVDVRDAAQAIEKSLMADFEGSHPLFINDTHNYWQYDVGTLTRLFYPNVTHWTQSLNQREALISIAKARALIGFDPVYSVRDA